MFYILYIYFLWKRKMIYRTKYKIIVFIVYLKNMRYRMFVNKIYIFFRFLTGTTSGLRLGCTMMDKRNLFVEPWKKFTQVYQKLRNKDTVIPFIWFFFFPFWRNYFDDRTNVFQGLFSDLTSYMLMTTRSVEKLNEKLERPVPTLQFRPNILVSTQQPFEEDNWEWIKIGERVVIRNVKPCSRYSKNIFDITKIYTYIIIIGIIETNRYDSEDQNKYESWYTKISIDNEIYLISYEQFNS